MNQPGTVDLPRPEQVSPLVDEAPRALGTIDILVNNVGTLWAAPAEDHPDSGWREVMGLNIDALFFLAREIGKRVMLPKRSGKILNVASLAGLGGSPSGWKAHLVSYHASKAAVIGLTRALATEWGPHGIHVNAIGPGVFPSPMADDLGADATQEALSATPLQRLGGR